MMRRLSPWLIAAVVLAFYGPQIGRYLTSEDFLLVRFLDQHRPWWDLRTFFGSSFLGVSLVKFWRPVSTLLHGVEVAIFGGSPAGYNMVSGLLHAGNALLVWAIARRLSAERERDAAAPLAAALLFAVYPLHPNAVLWGAGVGSLLAATLCLAATERYLCFREKGRRRDQWLALGVFAAGLGSYEAAVALPLVLAGFDHLWIGRGTLRRHVARALGHLPFFALLAVYFVVRRHVLGVFVGGYEAQGRSLADPQFAPLLRDFAMSIYQLHVPLYERAPDTAPQAVAILALVGLPLALAPLLCRSDPGFLRRWLFGWAWTIAFMAPFAFRPAVPGTGRYWYLAAVGIALSLAFLARAASGATTSRAARILAPSALGLLGIFWAAVLIRNLATYNEAGETARAIQQGLVRQADPAAVSFLARYPYFLTNSRAVPIAQVYHYGVWDSVHPPFVQTERNVYPLPQLEGAELLPVRRGAPNSRIYVWDAESRDVREAVPPAPAPEPQELNVLVAAPPRVEIEVPPNGAARFRLIVVARGNGTILEMGPEAVRDGVFRASLPDEFCRAMVQLYGDHVMFWWVEARDAGGDVSAFTRLRSFRLSESE